MSYRRKAAHGFLLFALLPSALAAPRMRGGDALARLPLRFETNRGQTDPAVQFVARAPGYTIFLTPTQAVYAGRAGSVTIKLAGANPAATLEGQEPQQTRTHYLLGDHREAWRSDVDSYARLVARDVYPGIDLAYYGGYGGQNQLEYDFVVRPGGGVSRIELEFDTAAGWHIGRRGELVLKTAAGEFRHHPPRIYQEFDRSTRAVSGRFVARGRHRVGFRVGAYDRSRPLVIDPVLSYSTYLGGSGNDAAYGIAVDSAGCAYIVGETGSLDFPRVNPAQASFGGVSDVLVAKLNASGTALMYATYLGGSSRDSGRAIAVDAAGNAYITGFTDSTNFPVTAGALQTSAQGYRSAFVVKLNPAGSAIVYATYLGGSGETYGAGIALDSSANAYVTGYTSSLSFPTTAGAFRRTYGGGFNDAFAAKLNPAGSALVYSTYLGGSAGDTAGGIAVDASGNAYLTGQTASSDFPVQNGFQPTKAGTSNAFVTKLNAAGSALVYSSFLGGIGVTTGTAIAIDPAGNAYLTGSTASANFPVTAGAYQTVNRGGYDAFVTKVGSAGNALVYSTLVGGSAQDQANAIAVDGAQNAYITGLTASADFPGVAAEGSYHGGYDCYAAGLNAPGTALLFLAYAGGSGFDQGQGIAAAASGTVFAAGVTYSNDFTTLPGAWQGRYGGSGDAFVLRSGSPVLLFQNDSTWEVQAWWMGGPQGGTMLRSELLNNAVPPGGSLVGAADLDGNGAPDLLWQNEARIIGVTYMGGPQGTTVLSTVQLNGGYPIATGWNLVGTADLNGDGVPDLLWQNPTIQKIGVWYMGGPQGATTLSMVHLNGGNPIALGWNLVGAADLNGDGVPDLLWQNLTIQDIGVWYMGGPQGGTALSKVLLNGGNPVAASWNLVGTVDLEGEGPPDLLWYNPTSQNIGVWYMGGPQGGTALLKTLLNDGSPIGRGWRLVAGIRH